jgi:GT2 family glycosyltransferase
MDARNGSVDSTRRSLDSFASQIYPRWRLLIADVCSRACDVVSNQYDIFRVEPQTSRNAALKQLIGQVRDEFFALIDPGDTLRQDALAQVVIALNKHSDANLIYTDEDTIEVQTELPRFFFKPDWSPDLLLSMNYIGRLAVYRSEALTGLVSEIRDEPDIDYYLALKATESSRKPVHIALPLYTRERSYDAFLRLDDASRETIRRELEQRESRSGMRVRVVDGNLGSFHVRYKFAETPLVSIIIITSDMISYLRRCLDSLHQKTVYPNYEILIVDHQSRTQEAKEFFGRCPHRVLRYESRFNFARINNMAASECEAELLLFLNNDTEIVEPLWLTEMVGVAMSRDNIGIVGAKLLFPDRTIQHGGAIVGVGGTAVHAFYGLPENAPAYYGFAQVRRNWSTVTAACMMTKREVFEKLGGFDETFSVGGNDVDYCLRAAKIGYMTVYTPYAVLYHHEGVTRGRHFPASNHYHFLKKWRETIRQGDPYYNPNLSLQPGSLFTPILLQGWAVKHSRAG